MGTRAQGDTGHGGHQGTTGCGDTGQGHGDRDMGQDTEAQRAMGTQGQGDGDTGPWGQAHRPWGQGHGDRGHSTEAHRAMGTQGQGDSGTQTMGTGRWGHSTGAHRDRGTQVTGVAPGAAAAQHQRDGVAGEDARQAREVAVAVGALLEHLLVHLPLRGRGQRCVTATPAGGDSARGRGHAPAWPGCGGRRRGEDSGCAGGPSTSCAC